MHFSSTVPGMDTTDELDALFKEAIGTFEGLLERAHTEQPPERPFACKAGCTSCCYQPEITITAIEVFRLAKFIGAQFSDDQIADLIKTLPETLKLPLVPLDPTSWSQIGMASAGHEHELLNLAPALAIVLGDPDAMGRWQNGEQVFATAQTRL